MSSSLLKKKMYDMCWFVMCWVLNFTLWILHFHVLANANGFFLSLYLFYWEISFIFGWHMTYLLTWEFILIVSIKPKTFSVELATLWHHVTSFSGYIWHLIKTSVYKRMRQKNVKRTVRNSVFKTEQWIKQKNCVSLSQPLLCIQAFFVFIRKSKS